MVRDGVGATLETAFVVIIVFLIQSVVLAIGIGIDMFALAMPFDHRPWTIFTSVYAHANIMHLATNLLALLIFGSIVERRSTRRRFHTFIVSTGAIAGISEVLVGSLLGPSPLVVGISGAVFALMGYVVASNAVTDAVSRRVNVDPRLQFGLMIILAAAITWVTAGERVALVAHFTGFLIGLMAGRMHLLRAQPRGS